MISDQQFFNILDEIAKSGTCSRLQVAAIIVSDNRMVSPGYNGTARGLPHCHHDDNKPCHKSVHAEANAIVFAARYGIKTLGTTLYCTHAPCDSCAGLIINAGIESVKYANHYRNDNGIKSLEAAGVHVEYCGTKTFQPLCTRCFLELEHESSADTELSVSHPTTWPTVRPMP